MVETREEDGVRSNGVVDRTVILQYTLVGQHQQNYSIPLFLYN